MKYSQISGVALALVLIAVSFIPWVHIASIDATITGMHTTGTNFGKPAFMNIFFSVIAIALFLVPKLWAKRVNLFICALNMAWAIRNFFVVTTCFGGECPAKKAGIYLLLVLAGGMLVMCTLPKLQTK